MRVRGYLSVPLIFHSWRLKLLTYSYVLAIISWKLLAPPPHSLENYLLNPFAHSLLEYLNIEYSLEYSLLELFVVLMVNLLGSLGILDSNPILYECCPYFLLFCMLSFHSGNYFCLLYRCLWMEYKPVYTFAISFLGTGVLTRNSQPLFDVFPLCISYSFIVPHLNWMFLLYIYF